MTERDVKVDAHIIGGGPAGLAVAAELKKRGLRSIVLERSDHIGNSWRGHYDRLHLHTPRELSGLPGLAIPKEMGRGVPVARVDHGADGAGWSLTLTDGSQLSSPYAVVATGFNHTPVTPDYPGLAGFTGELCTAHDYRNGGAFAGRDVLVVGTGNTGTEIAVDLVEHGARRVRLAVRTVPHIVRRNTGPIAAQYTGIAVRRLPLPVADWLGALTGRLQTPDLSAQGLPRPDTGILTRVVRDNAIPVQDVGIIDAIRSGRVEPVAALAGFDGAEVELADGSRIEPDAVILATGYTQGLAPLIGHLGVLDDKGLLHRLHQPDLRDAARDRHRLHQDRHLDVAGPRGRPTGAAVLPLATSR